MEPQVMIMVWAAMLILALLLEAQTTELVAIWFVPGILISLILSVFEIRVAIQWIVFASVSAVLLVLAFTVFRKKILKNHGTEPTDTELLLGRDAKVVSDIDNSLMQGEVKIDGKIWSARMAEDSEMAVTDEFVTVTAISGVKLICKRKPSSEDQ
jgi:membrane protein implicated in regulation of membrane protease activity